MRKFLSTLIFILCLLTTNVVAQVNTDTPNLSFEDGSLNGWKAYTGEYFYDTNVTSPTFGTYTYRWNQDQTTSRVQIISNNSATYDPVVACDLLTNPTNKSVVRLGTPNVSESWKGGSPYLDYSAAEKIEYSFKVTEETSLLSYKLAAVLHTPVGDNHLGEQRPTFSLAIKVVDQNGLSYSLPCSSYSSVAAAGGGLIQNTNCLSSIANSKRQEFMYQPWLSGNVDLKAHIGKTATIIVMTHDCLLDPYAGATNKAGGHSAHGYFWAETKKLELQSFSCENADATIEAPQGFSSYTWTRSDGKPVTVLNPLQPYIATIEKEQNVEGVVYSCAMNDVNSSCGALTISTTITPVKLYPDFTNAAVDAGKIQFTDASTATGDNISNYHWDFGDGSYSSQQNPEHEYFEFKPFAVKLTVTSSKGCSKTIIKNVLPTKELIADIFPPANLQYNGQTKDFSVTTNIAGLQQNIDYYVRYTNLPGTPFYNSYSAPANAGSYNAIFELSYVNLLKYYMSVVPSKNFTIAQAPLTITVSDVEKTYGEPILLQREAFTQSLKPLYAGDKIYELNLTCAGLADTASVGSYPIVADLAIGLGVSNYNIQFVDGNLKVNAKPITIKAIDAQKTYGDIITPIGNEFFIAPNSLIASDAVTSVNFTCAGFAQSAIVTNYPITPQNATGLRLKNYLITYVPANLQVLKKNLTITANALTKTYGDVYTFGGNEYSKNPNTLIGTDNISNVQFASAATAFKASVGDYPISITGVTGTGLANYTISYVNSNFKVNPLAITIKATDAEKEYSSLVNFGGNEFTTDKPLVTGDLISFVLLKSNGSTVSAPIGNHDITASSAYGVGTLNYDFSYQVGQLKVVQKKITAALVPPANLTYNGQQKEFTANISVPGFVLYANYVIRYTSTDNSYNSTTPPVTVGDYKATFELLPSTLLNYSIDNAPTVNFSITKATVTLTANDASKTYGDNLVLLNEAYKSDLKPLYGSDKITALQFNCDGLVDTASVGSYPIVPINVIGSGLENYTFNFVNGTLTVDVKTLRVQGLDVSKTYGELFVPTGREFYVDPNMLVGTDTVKTISLNSAGFATSALAGQHHVSISNASGKGLHNYYLIYSNAFMHISKKNITVYAQNISKTYGSIYNFTTKEFTADKTAFVGTDNVQSVQLSSDASQLKAQVGDHILSIHSATGSGLENYNIKLTNAIFKVNPKPITITAKNTEKEYGALLTFNGNEFTLDKPLVVGDSILYVILKSGGAASLASVGDYNIVPSLAYGTGSMNYDFSYVPGNLKVNKKALSALLVPPTYLGYNAQNKDFTATLNVSGLVQNTDYFIRYSSIAEPSKFTYIAPSKVGTYTASFELNYSTTFNYTIASTPAQNFSITKAPLVITANNATKTYGENASIMSDAYTADMKPLFGNDLIFSTLFDCKGLVDTASVGTYAIRPTNVIGNGLDNYAITYQQGALTVVPKPITVRAIDAAKLYGEVLAGSATSFIIDARALVGTDKIDSVAIASDGLPANALVAKYPLKITNASGKRLKNYQLSYSDGLLQVYKKTIVVSADSLRKEYGTDYIFKGTEFVLDKTQLVGNDKINSVKLNSQGALKRASVGEYILSITDVSGYGLDNYDLKLQSNVFEVTPRSIMVAARDMEKGYGDVLSFSGNEFTLDRPMVNNDTISFVFLKSTGSTETAPIGEHTIIPSQAFGNGSLNYNISYRNAKLIVKQKALIVTAASYEKEYGQKDPDMRFAVHDTRGVEYLPTLFSGKPQRVAGEKPSNYAIKKGTLAISPNYNFNFVDGNLTIKKGLPYLDAAFSNDQTLTIMSDVIGTTNGDTPSGIVAVAFKNTNVSATQVLNGEAKNGLANLPDSMVVATVKYSGDDNYLPAERTINIYAIRYHTNAGDLANSIKHFDGNESIKLETPTRQQKYKFEGWYETPDFTGEPVRRIALGTYRDVDLYAKWVTSFDDLEIVVLFNQVLAVANPQNREFIYHSTFKWSKDGVPLVGDKQYLGFTNYVPTGDYKVEIYYEGNTPIQLDLKHTATISKSMVYPNPVKKSAPVSLVTEYVRATDVQVQVYTATGIQVHNVTVEKDADMFKIKGLKLAGVYFLRVLKNAELVEMHKIIVEN